MKKLAGVILDFCRIWIVAATVGMNAGCAHRPSAPETADVDYGRPPSNDYRDVIREHMDPLFFYWRTAQYKFTEPHPGWFRDPEELGGEIRYGYQVDVLINTRRPNGKYIGFKPYMFLFRDNLLIRELSPETGARRSQLPYED